MCYRYKSDAPKNQLEGVLNRKLVTRPEYIPGERNGFEHPLAPVITNLHPDHIQMFTWGLLPHWAKDRNFPANTLNARVESLLEKPSYRDSVGNRCLIPATSFTEWQWLDPKGKKKQKWQIWEQGSKIFCFAGLYSIWTDPATGEELPTYTIIMREAEGIMREIHNSALRMPMVVPPSEYNTWLDGSLALATPPELEARKDSLEELTLF